MVLIQALCCIVWTCAELGVPFLQPEPTSLVSETRREEMKNRFAIYWGRENIFNWSPNEKLQIQRINQLGKKPLRDRNQEMRREKKKRFVISSVKGELASDLRHRAVKTLVTISITN